MGHFEKGRWVEDITPLCISHDCHFDDGYGYCRYWGNPIKFMMVHNLPCPMTIEIYEKIDDLMGCGSK